MKEKIYNENGDLIREVEGKRAACDLLQVLYDKTIAKVNNYRIESKSAAYTEKITIWGKDGFKYVFEDLPLTMGHFNGFRLFEEITQK